MDARRDNRYITLQKPVSRSESIRAKISDATWQRHGLGVFGVILLALSAAVLGSAGSTDEEAEPEEDEEGHLEEIVLEVEDSIDLHSFPPAEIPSVVEEYLTEALDRGYTEVRLIHGRGIGGSRRAFRT